MLQILAQFIVLLTGLYFIGLAGVAFFAPERAGTFLLAFAGSASKHYTELLIRLIVGAAFLYHAPQLPLTDVFTLFGWVLIISTAGLCFIPWRWHHTFAQKAVPHAIRRLKLVAAASLILGLLVLAALLLGGPV